MGWGLDDAHEPQLTAPPALLARADQVILEE
jgi:hypothetical protein